MTSGKYIKTAEHRKNLSLAHAGKKLSEEHKAALKLHHWSHSAKFIHPMKNKHHSKEARQKISDALKGKILSDETKNKMSISQKGHTVSVEARKKIGLGNSISLKGKKIPKEVIKKRLMTTMLRHGRVGGFNKGKSFEDIVGIKKAEEWKRNISKAGNFKNTSIEIIIQNFLKLLEIEFFTQIYIHDIKHAYRCDIFIPFFNLIIECDGDYWHGNPSLYSFEKLNQNQKEHIKRDYIRTKELNAAGYRILRLTGEEISRMTIDDFVLKLRTK